MSETKLPAMALMKQEISRLRAALIEARGEDWLKSQFRQHGLAWTPKDSTNDALLWRVQAHGLLHVLHTGVESLRKAGMHGEVVTGFPTATPTPSRAAATPPSSTAAPSSAASTANILEQYSKLTGLAKSQFFQKHKAALIAERSKPRPAPAAKPKPLTEEYHKLSGAAKSRFYQQNKAKLIAENQ